MFIIIQDTIINTDSITTISKGSTGYNSTKVDYKRFWKYYIMVKFNKATLSNKLEEKKWFHYDFKKERDKVFTDIKVSLGCTIVKDKIK